MIRFVTCVVLVLLAPLSAYADVEPEHRISAKPIKQEAPVYPRAELRRGNQGWVELNFVVSKEGEVLNPVVEASSGSRSFEAAALKTVKQYQFEPAIVNGEPVRQCKTKIRISFAIEGSSDKVSEKFHRGYKRIDRLLAKGETEEAEKRLQRMFDMKGLTLGEISWLWALKARIASLDGDKAAELKAVKRALGGSSSWLTEELRSSLLQVRVVREIETGDYAAALETWEALQSTVDVVPASIEPVIARIESLASGDQLFYREGRIGENPTCESCDDNWQYRPLRRSIELGDVEGNLDSIELRCDWQHYVDEARTGTAWKIPDSWGDCKVVLVGEPGTRFKLYEIPST